jgi:hypothetical protein
MSLEDEVQRIMDMGVKATPAGIRALTEGPQYVADPVGDIFMPMLAANREAILRIAREMDEVKTGRSPTQINRASRIMATLVNRFAKPSEEVELWE